MSRFISEPITPLTDHAELDTAALAQGGPALPGAFQWRKRAYAVRQVLSDGKGLRRESFSGELYLRRHEWRLLMDDGAIWAIYFLRLPMSGQPKGPRWFLKTVEQDGTA